MIETVLSIAQIFGFPVACVVVMGVFIYRIWKENTESNTRQQERLMKINQEREDKMFTQIEKFNDTLNNFNTTLSSIDARIEVLENGLKYDRK